MESDVPLPGSLPYDLPLLIGGALRTELTPFGMPQGMNSALFLLEHTEILADIYKKYLEAGVSALVAPTSSANRAVLERNGFKDSAARDVAKINLILLKHIKEISSGGIMIGGALSFTGLKPPPFGEVPFRSIIRVYEEQATALADAGADFLLCESMSNMWDTRAAILACRKTGLPVFMSMALSGEEESPEGLPFASFLTTSQALGAAAVGINGFTDFNHAAELFEKTGGYAKVPLIAIPAECADDHTASSRFAGECERLLKMGAGIVGDCAGATLSHIKALKSVLPEYRPAKPKEEEEVLTAVDDRDVHFLTEENLLMSEEIEVGYGMEDDLIQLDSRSENTVRVHVAHPEDGLLLSEYAHMSNLPVMIQADSEDALKEALLHFQGLALVDSESEIDPEILHAIADEYGATVY